MALWAWHRAIIADLGEDGLAGWVVDAEILRKLRMTGRQKVGASLSP